MTVAAGPEREREGRSARTIRSRLAKLERFTKFAEWQREVLNPLSPADRQALRRDIAPRLSTTGADRLALRACPPEAARRIRGPALLGRDVARVLGLGRLAGARQAGDGDRLAPPRLPLVLAPEVGRWDVGSTDDPARRHRPHSPYGEGQRDLG